MSGGYHHKRGTLLFGRRKTKTLNNMRNGYNARSYASILQTGGLIDCTAFVAREKTEHWTCTIKIVRLKIYTCGYTRNNSKTLGAYIRELRRRKIDLREDAADLIVLAANM